MSTGKSIVVVFKTDGMGISDEQSLKEKLAKTFLTLTKQMDPLPECDLLLYRRCQIGM